MGDLGCQGSQGGQSFALPQTLLGRKDPPIETGILNGDRTQVSQSPKDQPLIVIETMVPIHVKGEQTDRFLLVDDRSNQHGMQILFSYERNEMVFLGAQKIPGLHLPMPPKSGPQNAIRRLQSLFVFKGTVFVLHGMQFQQILFTVIKEKSRQPAVQKKDGFAGNRFQNLLHLSRTCHILTNQYQSLQLFGLSAKLLDHPHALQNSACLIRHQNKQTQVTFLKGILSQGIDVQDSNRPATFGERSGHFRSYTIIQAKVLVLSLHIRTEKRLSMHCNPTGYSDTHGKLETCA